eukprot:3495472-Amphidinium_carterae.2
MSFLTLPVWALNMCWRTTQPSPSGGGAVVIARLKITRSGCLYPHHAYACHALIPNPAGRAGSTYPGGNAKQTHPWRSYQD